MTDSQTESQIYQNHLWDRRSSTIYRVRVSVLYHLKRERFFDVCDKWTAMAVAVAATSAVGLLLKEAGHSPELWAAAITAILALVPLVVNPAHKARNHAGAAGEFRRLLAECTRTGERWSEAQCDQFAGKVVELEATEPAPLCALVIDCQNQLNIASGKPEERVPLRFYERWLKQWIDFDASKIVGRHEKQVARQHPAHP